jgi:uncharacterized lipoprotein NlpE involved in copper resistance
MKKIIYIVIILSLLLVGCKNKENAVGNTIINYEGKSQNWEVTYKIEGNEKKHDSYYTFKYIGTDAKPKAEVQYSIDGPKEGESDVFLLKDKNEYSGKMKNTGGMPGDTDRGINVKLEWDGKTEILVLSKLK